MSSLGWGDWAIKYSTWGTLHNDIKSPRPFFQASKRKQAVVPVLNELWSQQWRCSLIPNLQLSTLVKHWFLDSFVLTFQYGNQEAEELQLFEVAGETDSWLP